MRSRLLNRGFLSLMVTQFFGAANDNLLKGVLTYMVIKGTWEGRLGAGGQGIVGLCFTLPFILLSGYAGRFADRMSKRDVAVLVKLAEIPIAILGMIGFLAGNLWITLAALVVLTSQAAFFGPAKYGMIPELVDDEDLSRANGMINMMTNIAVIVGTLAAGVISDQYDPLSPDAAGIRAAPLTWLPGAAMTAVAIAGFVAVLFLPPLKPGNPRLRFDPNPFGPYVTALREMAKSPLLLVALAWGYFYLLAGLGLLIIPEYTGLLGITREAASRLLGIMAVAIGAGSIVAGFVSGRRIEPRLIPVGSAGMSVFFVLLGVVPPTFLTVSLLIFGAGFFAGFYIIPFQALLQHLSPADERGRFLGTANGISFGFLSIASLLYWAIRPVFGSRPQLVFLVCAALMVGGSAFFLVRLRRALFSHGLR